MKIGPEDGESLPMSCIIPKHGYGPNGDYNNSSVLHWRDATISLGYYFLVLSTEYYILHNADENVEPTLNELYYAITALNRLDITAEDYLSEGLNSESADDLNGLFLRDDVYLGFEQNWLGDPPLPDSPIPNDPGNPNNIRGDFHGWDGYGLSAEPLLFSRRNVMSLDQITTILLGLRFVAQLVEPDVNVQPTENDEVMNIRDEAISIIWRIIDNMNDLDSPIEDKHEWVIKKWDDQIVPGGPNCAFASYPIVEMVRDLMGDTQAESVKQPEEIILQFSEEKICEAIWGGNLLQDAGSFLGYNLLGTTVGMITFGDPDLPLDISAYSALHCTFDPDDSPVEGPLPIKLDVDDIGEFWHALAEQEAPIYLNSQQTIELEDLDFDYWTQNFNMLGIWFHHVRNNLTIDLGDPFGLFSDDPLKMDEDNVHILLELSTLGGVWDFDYTNQIAGLSDMQHIAMMYAALHNGGVPYTNMNQMEYRNILSQAPCAGPYADPDDPNNVAIGWASPNRLFHPGGMNTGTVGDWEYRGFFPGIDYMVYYNLYHMLWKEDSEYYPGNLGCSCVYEVTSLDEISTNLTATRKFSDYKEMGIPIESYLAHSLLVNDGALLDVQNDLVLCREFPEVPTILTIGNGSEMKLWNGNTITVRAGNKIIVDGGSTFTAGIEGCAKIVLEENAELIVRGGSTLISPGGIDVVMNAGSKLTIEDATFDISYGGAGSSITANSAAQIHFDNGAFNMSTLAGMVWNLHENSVIIFDNSVVELGENSIMNLFDGSEIQHNSGWLFMKPNSKINLLADCKFTYNGGSLSLKGSTTHMHFNGGQLHIAPGQTFTFTHDGTESGYIQFSGYPHDLYTGLNSKFKLQGDGNTDVILKITDGSNLWNANFGQGTIELLNGKVQMDNGGGLWTDMKFIANNVRFEDLTPPSGTAMASVQVWYTNTCNISNSFFTDVNFQTHHTRSVLYNVEFENAKSGMDAAGGSYQLTNCDFTDCNLESSNLGYISRITNGFFDPLSSQTCVEDESDFALAVTGCVFTGTNAGGIYKQGGKLSLRCNQFDGTGDGAIVSDAILNMSSADMAGYNVFESVDNCILLDDAEEINLYRGFNNLSGYSEYCIFGTLNDNCPAGANCLIENDALNNHWGMAGPGEPQFPDGSVGPAGADIDVVTTTEPYDCTSDGPFNIGCTVNFIDPAPGTPNGCGTGTIVVRPEKNLEVTSSIGNKVPKPTGILKDYDVTGDNPLINTTYFSDVPLDSALVVAATYMELYDSLASDAMAVELFHQILTDSLNRNNNEVRWKMKWGQQNMKNALENMFLQGELDPELNVASFEYPVQQYVDVLNVMTDTLLTDSTYQQQFYLELDKAQLFRSLGQQEVAQFVFSQLDNCSLDSLQQNMLNNWLQLVDIELTVYEQYILSGIAPDSLNYQVDTTSYVLPVALELDEHYFGLWIDSPGDLTFMACGTDPGYKTRRLQLSGELSVYPNPNHGLCWLIYNGADCLAWIEVHNALGELVWRELTAFRTNSPVKLEMNDISEGIYTVSVVINGTRISERVVLTR